MTPPRRDNRRTLHLLRCTFFKAFPRVGCPQLNASKLVFPPVDRGLIKFNSYPPPAHHLDSGLIWFSASIGARCLLTVYDSCSTGADKKERINNRCKNLAHAHGDGCCSFFFRYCSAYDETTVREWSSFGLFTTCESLNAGSWQAMTVPG